MATRSVETDPAKGTGKRERILRAAIEVFARTGYFNSKVSEIAKEAGVADGTIYLYFLGKEDLLISIFREHMRAYLEAVGQVMAGERDPQARIRKVIRFHLESDGGGFRGMLCSDGDREGGVRDSRRDGHLVDPLGEGHPPSRERGRDLRFRAQRPPLIAL